jgi:transcriptional regulator with AAA-type ATPase domain
VTGKEPGQKEHDDFLFPLLEGSAVSLIGSDPDGDWREETVRRFRALNMAIATPGRGQVTTILLQGEPGVGKTRLAKLLCFHRYWAGLNPKDRKELATQVQQACNADPPTDPLALFANTGRVQFRNAPLPNVGRELFDAFLFGTVKGAFTGATDAKGALSHWENKATSTRRDVFLDEVGDLHPDLQAKLLALLSSGTFSPVGAPGTTFPVADRLVFASNRDLREVEGFRRDLLDRMAWPRLQLATLRQVDKPTFLRAAQITVSNLTETFGGGDPIELYTPDDLEVLWGRRRSWHGNFRQMTKVLEALVRYRLAGVLSPVDEIASEVERSFGLVTPVSDLEDVAAEAAERYFVERLESWSDKDQEELRSAKRFARVFAQKMGLDDAIVKAIRQAYTAHKAKLPSTFPKTEWQKGR